MTKKKDVAVQGANADMRVLFNKDDFYRFIGALAFAAVGVSFALCLAAQLFPVSAPLSGSNLDILPSMQGQAQAEPREKGFLVLAAVFGFLGAMVGAYRHPFRIAPKRWHWVLLGSLVPVLNFCIGFVMSSPSATPQAVAVLIHSAVVVLIFSHPRSDPGAD